MIEAMNRMMMGKRTFLWGCFFLAYGAFVVVATLYVISKTQAPAAPFTEAGIFVGAAIGAGATGLFGLKWGKAMETRAESTGAVTQATK